MSTSPGLWTAVLVMCCGCALPGPSPGVAVATPSNPLLVASRNEELVWERAVDVLHDFHFEIARENRLGRVIETKPLTGSGLLEPWHLDAVGFASRLEGSLQSIRRIVHVSLQPDERSQGYLVSVAAYKEIEDIPGVTANSPGVATFSESTPLERDVDLVLGQSTPSVWVPMGRDPILEAAILTRMRSVYAY